MSTINVRLNRLKYEVQSLLSTCYLLFIDKIDFTFSIQSINCSLRLLVPVKQESNPLSSGLLNQIRFSCCVFNTI